MQQNYERASWKLYKKYEYLAVVYANKIYDIQKMAYEKDDLIQDLKMKIYTSILSYSEKWQEYKKTGQYKPVPLLYYIKASLVNIKVDFIKTLNRGVDAVDKISIQDNNFDYGVESSFSEIDFVNKNIVVRGVDLLEGLECKKERGAFCLYLKGFSFTKINKVFKGIQAESVIKNQIKRLECYKEDLLQTNKSFVQFNMESVED